MPLQAPFHKSYHISHSHPYFLIIKRHSQIAYIHNKQPTSQMIHQGSSFSPRAAHMIEEHIEAIKETLAAGFLQKNEIWSAFGIKKQDILSFFDRVSEITWQQSSRSALALASIQSPLIMEVVGCKPHYGLQTYLQIDDMDVDQKYGDFKLFEFLQKVGAELTKDLDFSHYPKGRTAFINFGGYHPESNLSNLLKVVLFTQINQGLKQSGFDQAVGRLSNARAMDLYKKFGAKILSSINFQPKGNAFQLFFFQMSLHTQVFCRWLQNLQNLAELERNYLQNLSYDKFMKTHTLIVRPYHINTIFFFFNCI